MKGPQTIVDESYDAVQQSCLWRSEGDQQRADYLQDCGYWEYYYRMLQYNTYVNAKNEAQKKALSNK